MWKNFSGEINFNNTYKSISSDQSIKYSNFPPPFTQKTLHLITSNQWWKSSP